MQISFVELEFERESIKYDRLAAQAKKEYQSFNIPKMLAKAEEEAVDRRMQEQGRDKALKQADDAEDLLASWTAENLNKKEQIAKLKEKIEEEAEEHAHEIRKQEQKGRAKKYAAAQRKIETLDSVKIEKQRLDAAKRKAEEEKKNSDGRLKKLESTLDAENKDLQRAQANKAKSHQRYLDMQEAKSKHDKAVADAKQNLHDLSKDVAKFNKADRKKKIMEPDGVHGNPIYKRASGS